MSAIKDKKELPNTSDVAEAIASYVREHCRPWKNPKNGRWSFNVSDDYAIPFNVGGVFGRLSVSFSSLSDAAPEAATTESISARLDKLTPEDRRKLLEAELAKLD